MARRSIIDTLLKRRTKIRCIVLIILVNQLDYCLGQGGCGCSSAFDPHCASNGRTYGNSCEFDCARRGNSNLGLVFRGECGIGPGSGRPPQFGSTNPNRNAQQQQRRQDQQECLCFDVFDPVCATNGVTYNNECRLGCERARLAHRGFCQRDGGPARPSSTTRRPTNNNRPPLTNRPNNNNRPPFTNRPNNNNNNRPPPFNNRPTNRPGNNNNNRPVNNNNRPNVIVIRLPFNF